MKRVASILERIGEGEWGRMHQLAWEPYLLIEQYGGKRGVSGRVYDDVVLFL